MCFYVLLLLWPLSTRHGLSAYGREACCLASQASKFIQQKCVSYCCHNFAGGAVLHDHAMARLPFVHLLPQQSDVLCEAVRP